jgi:hypothetical protein
MGLRDVEKEDGGREGRWVILCRQSPLPRIVSATHVLIFLAAFMTSLILGTPSVTFMLATPAK